jgi:DNA-binding winged helix-turn-helix (wHTH) protein/TolB-like protein
LPQNFGDFTLSFVPLELRRSGTAVKLQDLPLRLLAALAERPGVVVSRAELSGRLWGPGTFVDAEAGLNTAVAKLREALGDDAAAPSFIETVPKRGYRLVTPATPKPRQPSRLWRNLVVGAGLLAAVALGGWFLRPSSTRVAVALFDNETGLSRFDPVAQQLTDAAVLRLTRETNLAVIGNAAILRTDRPFRDLTAIRATLDADYVVIGQIQPTDGAHRVLLHLIRGADEAHVWAESLPFEGQSATTSLEARVGEALVDALRGAADDRNEL